MLEKKIHILLIFIFFDCLTGIIKSLKNHSLKSAIFRNGGYKKFLVIFIVLMCKFLDSVFLESSDILYSSSCIYYILNECISICENLTEIGIKIPNKLKKWLKKEYRKNDR